MATPFIAPTEQTRLPDPYRPEAEVVSALAARVGTSLNWAQVIDMAAPWVELSLLGLRDEVLVRRALSPSELGLDASVLALRDVDAALRFQLPEDLAPTVTGYKATLFYP